MIYSKRLNHATFEVPTFKHHFRLDTVDGRDTIIEQLKKDIETFCTTAYTDAEPRSHLGASIIGDECERKIWFNFRWMGFEKFSGRMLRLFYRGHREEDALIEILRGVGCDVQQVGEDGKQLTIEKDCDGHFGGSNDSMMILPIRYGPCSENGEGRCMTKILVEYKTANSKSFNEVCGPGVQKAKPQHYDQMCIYGYKFKVRYAIYIIVNKNDDDIWIEMVELDWGKAEALIAKADKIVHAQVPPPRMSNDPSYFKCKFCAFNGICHFGHKVERNCRSCKNAIAVANGQWHCNQWNAIIPKEAILQGCDAWTELPR